MVWKVFLIATYLSVSLVSSTIRIQEGPSRINVTKGDDVTLTCTSSNVSAIKWLLNDKPIYPAYYLQERNATHSILKVLTMKIIISGNYSCSMVNLNGIEEKSDNIALFSIGFESLSGGDVEYFLDTKRYAFTLIAYPAVDDIKLFHNDQEVVSSDDLQLRNITRQGSKGRFHRYRFVVEFLNLSNILPGERSGLYDFRFTWKGKAISLTSKNITILDECGGSNKFKCETIPKCVYDFDKCDNSDQCGDLSDEKNCTLTITPSDVKMQNEDFNGWKVYFLFYDPYDVVAKVFTNQKMVREQKIVKNEKITGITPGQTYNITFQAISITGILGPPVHVYNVYLPNKMVPIKPRLLDISHFNYDTIYIDINSTQPDEFVFHTNFSITDEEGKQIQQAVVTNERTYLSLGKNVLLNGTTYSITVQSENSIGKSEPLYINYTIPRMVAPGPARNVTIKTRRRWRDSISVIVSYKRPLDDGGYGRSYIDGFIEYCYSNATSSCKTEKTLIYQSASRDEWISDLKGETKYKFIVQLRSQEKQKGLKVTSYFTTPSLMTDTDEENKGGLSIAVIAGIIAASLGLLSSLCGFIIKCCCLSSDDDDDVAVNYHVGSKDEN